jgi:probable HAF family extracellular repeat protein
MKVDRWKSLILGLFALHILAYQSDAAPSYTIQDLGVDDAMKASGPNLSGQSAVRLGSSRTVGSSRITPGAEWAATPGLAQDETARALASATADSLGLLSGGDHTTANAINDSGTVVGSANGKTSVRPVIWTKTGGLQDLGTLPGDNAGEAFGVNNSGIVVGYSGGPQGISAFLWTSKDGMQSLVPLLAGESSKAFGISDNGLVVGSSGSPMGTHAGLWSRGGIQDLGTLPGDTGSEALAVNNQGSVVGYSKGPAGTRAFLWTSPNGMQALNPLPGGRFTRALGINERGDVVGTSDSFDGRRAVLWSAAGNAQDVNTLVAVPVGMLLSEAVGINSKGQILTLTRNEMDAHSHHEGFNRVFLLTPGGQ